MRVVLLILTVAGFGITIGGFIAAYVSASKAHRDAQTRIDKMLELEDNQGRETAHLREMTPVDDAQAAARDAELRDINARYAAEYEQREIVQPGYHNLAYLAAFESRRLLGLVLDSTRNEFLVAGAGLLVSTAASVGSLFLTS